MASNATRGKAAQMLFVALALEYNWNPQLTLNEDLPFDVVIQLPDEGYVEVQVKRMYRRGDRPTPIVSMKRKHGKYGPHDADYLAAVDMERGGFYLIPWAEVYDFNKKSISDEEYGDHWHDLGTEA